MDYIQSPIELLYNSSSWVEIPIVTDSMISEFTTGISLTGSYTIFEPGGNVLQGETPGLINGNYMRISFPGSTTYQQNFRIDYKFVEQEEDEESESYNRSIYFDTVVMLLNPLLTDRNLLDEYPLLDDLKWNTQTDWRRFKWAAWQDIRSSISARGFRPALCAPSSNAFTLPHKHLTFAKIFKSLFSTVGDEWYERWKYEDEQYHLSMADVLANLKYDFGETKVIPQGSEVNVSSQKVWR